MSLSIIKQYFKSGNYFHRPLHGRRATYDEVKEVVTKIRRSGSSLGYRRVWSHRKTSSTLEDIRFACMKGLAMSVCSISATRTGP